jgi:hypothetical protein
MDQFFQSNPGFRSRIAHHIDFPDYTGAELMAIAESMLAAQNYRFSLAAQVPSKPISRRAGNSRISPMHGQSAMHLTGRGCATPIGISNRQAPSRATIL